MNTFRVAKALSVALLAVTVGCSGWLTGAAHASAANWHVSAQSDSSMAPPFQEGEGASALPDLLVKAHEQGSVLVIAELSLPAPFAGEATLEPQAALDQRAAIAAASAAVRAALQSYDVQVAATFVAIPYIALRVDAKALLALASLPQVAAIQEDVPAAPALASSTQLLGLSPVWASGIEGAGQTVVILDTGIDTDHPFFASRLVDGACFSNAAGAGGYTSLCPSGGSTQYGVGAAESDAVNVACWNGTTSLCGHGSHVAGIAAGGNANTFDGVARGASIIAIQVFTRFENYAGCGGTGACVLTYTTDQMRALDYVYTTLRPARALASVNMSLGGGQYTSACDSDFRKAAIDNLRGAGIATVIAAGNNNYRNALSAPACISTAVAVGGVNDTDNPPADAVVYNIHSMVDLLAPARTVTSSYVGGGYATMSGTSMAAPHIAGAFALCKGANPALSVSQIETILEQTGVAIRDTRSSGVHTKPRPQMDAAVAACQQVAVWTGAVSTQWDHPGNWSGGAAPSPASFANIPSAPASGRFPAINGAAELRSLLLEPGARLNLAGATLTGHGSVELAATAQIVATGSTIVLSGAPLATITLPPGQRLHNLQIGNGSDQIAVALDSNLALDGNLVVQPAATFDLTSYSLSVEGAVANLGVLKQSKAVTAGLVEFLRIKNAAGSATRYWGVDIAPSAAMGNTAVSVAGNQGCGAGAGEIQRCYDVTPTTASTSNITFYYQADEAGGVTNPASYHWNGAIWEGPLPGTTGGSGDIMFVLAQGISAYSSFALRGSAPQAVILASFDAQTQPDHILLTWETVSEWDNAGFNLYRTSANSERPKPAHQLAFVPSQAPGSTMGAVYSFADSNVAPGQTYLYWLEDVTLGGATTLHGPVSVTFPGATPTP